MSKFKGRKRRERWLYHAILTHNNEELHLYSRTLRAIYTPVASCAPNSDSSQLTDPAGVGPKSRDNDICSSPNCTASCSHDTGSWTGARGICRTQRVGVPVLQPEGGKEKTCSRCS